MNGERRLALSIRGLVQGVGFRPFVARLAYQHHLRGWVHNTPGGVEIEAEGDSEHLEGFRAKLVSERPLHARIDRITDRLLEPVGYDKFSIRNSPPNGAVRAWLAPDIAACGECMAEVLDPTNRRYRYPFTTCTNCGPRYSIIERLPYDRENTSMARFPMCPACRAEYENPADRRFHSQTNACPDCGPQITFMDHAGESIARREEALLTAIAALRAGNIVAVKGIGGFHLMADARNSAAIASLRSRKNRPEKPFAIMAADLSAARELCKIHAAAARLLQSPAAPIVLLPRKPDAVCEEVAPANPRLGIMLAYTPLHRLILAAVGGPLVATSGNRGEEPICIDDDDARQQLADLADCFLMHDRPIVHRADDSVAHIVAGEDQLLRRSRGYAPLPVARRSDGPPLLAVGAHQKNTIAIAAGPHIFLSPHIGDLEGTQAYEVFRGSIAGFEEIFKLAPERVVCDLHPDYRSTQFGRASGRPVRAVQHHFAHALSCMAEHGLCETALAVVWDGTGYGADGTIWGGEFLRVTREQFERVDHLRTFCLPGGQAAIREPRRAAFGLLWEIFGDELPLSLGFSRREAALLSTMIRRGINAPRTSSAGRLFDAVAAICGLRHQCSFEGQAAMEFEFVIDEQDHGTYPSVSADWEPLVRAITVDVRADVPLGRIAARFHAALVEMIVSVARRVGERIVLLSGGCFQNRHLSERAIAALQRDGFQVYWHKQVPPNDGGIALGQAWAASQE